MEQDEFLNTSEAAAFLRAKPGTLEIWRSTKRYCIPYVRVGRLVRYRKSDLQKWLDSRQVGGEAA